MQRLLRDSRRPDRLTGPVEVLSLRLLIVAAGTHVACASLLPLTMHVADPGESMGVNARAKEEAAGILEIEEQLSKVMRTLLMLAIRNS